MPTGNERSLKYLLDKSVGDNIIVGGHPTIRKNEAGSLHIEMQEEAFEYAALLSQKEGGDIVLWVGNIGIRHSSLLKKDVPTGKSIYQLGELVDTITTPYVALCKKYNMKIADVSIIFQSHANGYVKNNMYSRKISEASKHLISHVLSVTSEDEEGTQIIGTNCKGTCAGFVRLSCKIDEGAKNLLICLGADPRCSAPDVAGGITAVESIFDITPQMNYAYFDVGRKGIPFTKCG